MEVEAELNQLKEWFEDLEHTSIYSTKDLVKLLKETSHIFDEVEEKLVSAYIDHQRNINGAEEKALYQFCQEKIKPLYKHYKAKLDKKLYLHKNYFKGTDLQYLFERISNSIHISTEDNNYSTAVEDQQVSEYFTIQGSMFIEWNGERLPGQELNGFLYEQNRDVRKNALTLLSRSYAEKEGDLQLLMDKMVKARAEIARDAGFSNYRNYMFCYYERDYSYEDCNQLAEAIQTDVVPLINQLNDKKRNLLKVNVLKPWDIRVTGNEHLHYVPYKNTDDMIDIAEDLLHKLDPSFSELLRKMKEKEQLDLQSHPRKAPGGFCEFLPQSKSSFIMLNLTNTKDDLPIFLHEMGHAIHHELMSHNEIHHFKQLPMETAEFAAMSIELLTLDSWRPYYSSDEEYSLVKRELFQQVLEFLPITIVVDQFQHWMYTNPDHSHNERNEKFKELLDCNDSPVMNWDGIEEWKELQWMDIIHIFETPFYFIEYAIAQIGALQLYRNYKKKPQQTLKQFKQALSLGSSKSIKEVYRKAGIEFDFSKETIQEVMSFVEEKINKG